MWGYFGCHNDYIGVENQIYNIICLTKIIVYSEKCHSNQELYFKFLCKTPTELILTKKLFKATPCTIVNAVTRADSLVAVSQLQNWWEIHN